MYTWQSQCTTKGGAPASDRWEVHKEDGEGREEEGDRRVITKRDNEKREVACKNPDRCQRCHLEGSSQHRGQPVGTEPWKRTGKGGVASSGRGAVATLTASNVVTRVELFSQALYYGSSWDTVGAGGMRFGLWVEVDWVRQESRDEISGGGRRGWESGHMSQVPGTGNVIYFN